MRDTQRKPGFIRRTYRKAVQLQRTLGLVALAWVAMNVHLNGWSVLIPHLDETPQPTQVSSKYTPDEKYALQIAEAGKEAKGGRHAH